MMISGIGFMGMNIRIGVQWESAIYLNLLTYIQFGLGIGLSAIGMILKKRKEFKDMNAEENIERLNQELIDVNKIMTESFEMLLNRDNNLNKI